MPKFISKSELETQKAKNRKTYNVGTIYPQIFSNDEITEFFKERGIDDEESVNDELDKLIASVQSEANAELPSANKEKLEEEKEEEKEVNKEKKVAIEA